MSTAYQPERRRTARIELQSSITCRVNVRSRVRLLDISLHGALLGTDLMVPVGTQGHLRMLIGAAPFAPALVVRRVATGGRDTEPLALGTMFTAMDDRSRRSLEHFLRRATE